VLVEVVKIVVNLLRDRGRYMAREVPPSEAISVEQQPWFAEGLRFECTRCGKCCTGEPGFVWVSEEEIQRIARFRGDSVSEFEAVYTRRARGRRTLRERANGDCVFWDRVQGCRIYPVRPTQCRTWPFWESNVKTQEHWQRTTEICPGSGQGNLISADEILRRVREIRI
jgi:Fe-S-cluster containining protein